MTRHDLGDDDAIRSFLGDDAARGGPFALLGLRYAPMDEGMILRACRSRLDQINAHRRGQTPAADEVRLAVHAAGSQLLDPALRQELAKHWPEGSGTIGGVGEAPVAWRVEATSTLDERVRQQALTLLGACGGWNARSRKRLGQFARLHQISAAQLVAGILGGDSGVVDDGSSDDGDGGPVRGPSVADPVEGAMPWMVIPVLFAAMGFTLVSAGYLRWVDRAYESRVVEAGEGGTVERSPASGGEMVRRGERSTTPKPARRHYSAIVHELERFEREGVSDTDSAAAFSKVGERLVDQWTEFPAADLATATRSVRRVLGGILNRDLFERSTAFIRIDAQAGYGSVLSAALRAWLFGGDDVDPAYGVMLGRIAEIDRDGALGSALGGAFDRRALTGTDEPGWWAWWIGQLGAIPDQGQRERVLFESVYGRLTAGSMGSDWALCSRAIVEAVGWGDGAGSRVWLMGVVADPKVRSDRLGVLTRAVVLYSSARGLGMEMVLAGDASGSQREAYLGKLRERWLAGGGVDDVRAQLIERIELLLRLTENTEDPEQSMTRAIEFAQVNSACWARLVGDEGMLLNLLEGFDLAPSGADPTIGKLDLSSSPGDAEWATGARNLEDREELLRHLDSLDRFDPIGPKSAHALVYLAMQAPDLTIRAQAERAMMLRRDEPAILIAMDRIVGGERATRRMVDLINAYVGYSGTLDDAAGSRRAILERLARIGVLDNGGERAYDDFSAAFNALYAMRTGSVSSDDGAEGVYGSMVSGLIAHGGSVPGDIRARLLVRLRIAGGAMQRFTAYQSAALELMAAGMVEEYPSLGSRVSVMMTELQNQRHGRRGDPGAGHVVVEMMLIERAMAELWLMRLEAEGMS